MLEFIKTSENCYQLRLDNKDYTFEEIIEEIFRIRGKNDSGHFFLNAPTDIVGLHYIDGRVNIPNKLKNIKITQVNACGHNKKFTYSCKCNSLRSK